MPKEPAPLPTGNRDAWSKITSRWGAHGSESLEAVRASLIGPKKKS